MKEKYWKIKKDNDKVTDLDRPRQTKRQTDTDKQATKGQTKRQKDTNRERDRHR